MALKGVEKYPEFCENYTVRPAKAITYLETEICTGNVVNPWSGRDYVDKGNAVIELAIKVWRGIVVETYFNSE